MKKNLFFIKVLVLLLFVSACNDDEEPVVLEFVTAFENPSVSFSTTDKSKEIKIVFSRSAPEKGTLTVSYIADNASYGTDGDFTTVPSGETGTITIPFNLDDDNTSFTFNKLLNPIEGVTKAVTFTLKSVSILKSTIKGNTNLAVSFTQTAALGGVIAPEVGGPTQPNQVFVDLSSQKQTKVKRDSWNLGFNNGEEFRVTLNGAIFMGAAKLNFTDINAVSETDVTELKNLIRTSSAGSNIYFDGPTGEISKTVIAKISENDEENKVYLLKLGHKIPTEIPKVGSANITGDPKGWKKIRILRKGNDYKLQYADIEDTSFKSVTISKNDDYNFTYFSFDNDKVVTVSPVKEKWDLNFTVFTNVISFGPRALGAYGFTDFVVTNLKGGANSYKVSTKDFEYNDFKFTDVNNESFTENQEDQRSIGSKWRNVFTKKAKEDAFFVLKDTDGNIYKIRFNAMLNDSGERGYPKFEYALLK